MIAIPGTKKSRVFDAGLPEGIRKLKAEAGKPIVAIGHGGFMRSLIATALIDEFVLAIHPVVLGAGLPISNGRAINILKDSVIINFQPALHQGWICFFNR